MNEPQLRSSWEAMWEELGAGRSDEKLFSELVRCYRQRGRKYHSLQHLSECLENCRDLRREARCPAEVELALWFHDAVYNVLRKDNELRSAEWAKRSILAAGCSDDAAQRVHDLVMATRHQAVPSGMDAQIVVDVDLWILGAPPERFDEYERQIREEYRHVPEIIFRPKRKAVLKSFLERQRIFATALFFGRHEAQARANLGRSLARLDA